jgi:hypothetical protein
MAAPLLAWPSAAVAKTTHKTTTTTAPKHNVPGPDVRYPPKTFDLFEKLASTTATDKAGHHLAAKTVPKAGDVVRTRYRDYTGNHTQHAATPSGTTSLTCTFKTGSEATCNGTLALGSSTLLMHKVFVDFASRPTAIAVTGGTGSFSDYHGLVSVSPVGSSKNADVTVIVAHKPSAKAAA